MVIRPSGLKVQSSDWKTWIYGAWKANSFKISATSMNIFSASPSSLFENKGILVFFEPVFICRIRWFPLQEFYFARPLNYNNESVHKTSNNIGNSFSFIHLQHRVKKWRNPLMPNNYKFLSSYIKNANMWNKQLATVKTLTFK
jgi:hypothetical protein